ncbi:MAG: hypothetical protein JM58_05825 [Peptococcaceae bacterium BICA1-8]|nr:MAG: hypothetical protein JM58_05825 [Peptococcaceae bacterium BICA1-8]
MSIKLSFQEFLLLQRFIKEISGIEVPENKSYLIENRLTKLLIEYKINNFVDLYYKLREPKKNNELVNKVIDAITIKETHWFRDKSPWNVMEDVLMPVYTKELTDRTRTQVRIWSAACSTGQEPYSIAMAVDNFITSYNHHQITLSDFDILATDLSHDALQHAKTGRYDSVSIGRGLNDEFRSKYLKQENRTWVIDEKIKNAVTFQQLNLKSSFLLLGKFDIIFCRYVAIYFCQEFRKQLFQKLAQALTPNGVLFLGNSELFPDYKDHFIQEKYHSAAFYRNTL